MEEEDGLILWKQFIHIFEYDIKVLFCGAFFLHLELKGRS